MTLMQINVNSACMNRSVIISYGNEFLFIISGSAAQRGPWPPRSRGFVTTHNDAPQSVGLLWTSDQLVAETSTWQHPQQTNIHAPGGIRTHDRSRRAAVDLRLRLRGQWVRPVVMNNTTNYQNDFKLEDQLSRYFSVTKRGNVKWGKIIPIIYYRNINVGNKGIWFMVKDLVKQLGF
jgi:hypothetical protein